MKKKTKSGGKILFIHNKAIWYRIPFFDILAKYFDTKFVFTRDEKNKEMAGDSVLLRPVGVGHFKISFALIPLLIDPKYKLIIFPPPDSPGEIIDNLICYSICRLTRKKYMLWSEAWELEETRPPVFIHVYKLF